MIVFRNMTIRNRNGGFCEFISIEKGAAVIAVAVVSGVCMTPVFAAEYHEPVVVNDTTSDAFFDQVGDGKVLPMPDGGFLYGSCIVTDLNNPDVILGIYDSELDPEAVSVEEAKQIASGEKTFVSHMGRSASPSTSLYIVSANTTYRSDTFSGSGWRFSNYYFLPMNGTGDYLLWTSFIDGGRVGCFAEAYSTLNGTLAGMELPVNTAKYYKNPDGQQYYTYNPIKGTYYVVSNPV